jgi:hypothetical protein
MNGKSKSGKSGDWNGDRMDNPNFLPPHHETFSSMQKDCRKWQHFGAKERTKKENGGGREEGGGEEVIGGGGGLFGENIIFRFEWGKLARKRMIERRKGAEEGYPPPGDI